MLAQAEIACSVRAQRKNKLGPLAFAKETAEKKATVFDYA